MPGPATNITESLVSEILTGWQTSQCRDFINNLAGSRRAFAHAQIYPGVGNLKDPAFGDYTQWQVEFCQPDSWKGYCVAPAASAAPGSEFMQWRLDDEVIAYPTYAVINANRAMLRKHPGFFNICIHKGLSASGTQPGGPNNTPDYGNPDDIVKAASDWPQFNFVIYHSCLRPSFWSLQSLLDIQNEPGSMAPTTLTDRDGHTVPNIRWSTQFAQIAGGKYVAGAEPTSTSPSSPFRLPNVYAELGTTMASMVTIFPTVFAHLIGQQLYYMGSEHIVFGSDSLWYGGPQWQIEALWRFQIPERIQEKWHYPALTEWDKRNILGLNSARLYGLHGRQAVPVGEPGSAYRTGQTAEIRVVGAAWQRHRHGAARRRLPDPDHEGQPDPRRQLDQGQGGLRRLRRQRYQHPARLDPDDLNPRRVVADHLGKHHSSFGIMILILRRRAIRAWRVLWSSVSTKARPPRR